MKSLLPLRPLGAALALCAVPLLPAVPTDPGLYAVFETSEGSFTAKLFFEEVPNTVANFASLAKGTRNWIDPETGLVHTNEPYYDGTIFHRVIDGFVIQGGDRLGTGTGGPGYRFRDEFDPALRHDKAGILSMANSGADTNGSQFFVTDAATPNLDDKHSVFGEVVEGLAVVQAIAEVTTDSNDRPVEDVVLQSVTIHAVGTDAQNFDETAQDLPDIVWIRDAVYSGTRGAIVDEDNPATFFLPGLRARFIHVEVTNDLQEWFEGSASIGLTNATEAGLTVNLSAFGNNTADLLSPEEGPDSFFARFAEIDYPFVLEEPVGRTLVTESSDLDSGQWVRTLEFTGQEDVTLTIETVGEPGSTRVLDIQDWQWEVNDYRAQVSLVYEEEVEGSLKEFFLIRLFIFEDENGGTTQSVLYNVTDDPQGLSPINLPNGTFTVSAP